VSSGKLKVIVHAGGVNVREQQILATHAQKIGAFAIASMAPAFLAPKRTEEFVAYCKTIASAAPNLPFYYYHIPLLNGFRLPVKEFLIAAENEIPTLAGVKYTDFNIFEFELCRKVANGKYEMLWGLDEMFLDSLAFGNNAGVGGTYNHCYSLYKDMRTSYAAKDMEKCAALQHKSHEFCEILGKYRGNLSGGKRMMKFMGLDCGPNRLPLQTISDDEEIAMKNDLEAIGFFEFCNR
ncbi:MAG: dihydrodipicolinate synthase family protein, partial [Bacteroidales bacterium]|nr:dihydrodipicolinate synthase family protein [Bacteroidales bacterium]